MSYNIEALSVVQGSGADLSASKPQERGDRHGQVSVLYGIPDRDISQLFPEETSRDSRGMDRSGTSTASSAMRPASSN